MLVEALASVVERIEGIRALMIVGRDGMVVASAGSADRAAGEALAATYADLLRRVDRGHQECGLDGIREWITGFDEAWVVVRTITPEYLLLAWTDADAVVGRVRFELRKAAGILAPELEE